MALRGRVRRGRGLDEIKLVDVGDWTVDEKAR